jgi:hypothetical protein
MAEFLGDSIIVAHNLPYDGEIIDRMMKDAGIDYKASGSIDTLMLLRSAVPKGDGEDGPERHTLGALADFFGVDLGDAAHTADADSEAAALVLAKAMDWADKKKSDPEIFDAVKQKELFDSATKKFNEQRKQYEEDLKKYQSDLEEYQRAVTKGVEPPKAEEVAPKVASGPRAAAKRLIQRLTRKNEAKLGSFDKNGYGVPQVVPVGNKGIGSLEQAVDHLDKGGDLADVPDDFLFDSIDKLMMRDYGKDNARFTKIGDGDGINGMTLVRDNQTNKLIGLKLFMFDHEGAAEYSGAHFAERIGFPNGVMRIAGPREKDTNAQAMVIELVQNYAGEIANTFESPMGLNPNYHLREVPTEDLVAMSLLDFIIGNPDRHQGNFFIVKDADGISRLVPIDHSFAFSVQPPDEADPESEWYNDPVGMDLLKKWLTRPSGGKKNEIISELSPFLFGNYRDKEEAVAAVEHVFESLRAAESESPVGPMIDTILQQTGVNEEGIPGFHRAEERMKWLLSQDPQEIARIIQRFDLEPEETAQAPVAPKPAGGGLYG